MSTISDLYCPFNNTQTRIYEETSEAVYHGLTFAGFNVYCFFDVSEVVSFTVNNGILSFTFSGELKSFLGDKMTFGGDNVSELEYDKETVSFCIRGGSYTANNLIKAIKAKQHNISQ